MQRVAVLHLLQTVLTDLLTSGLNSVHAICDWTQKTRAPFSQVSGPSLFHLPLQEVAVAQEWE